MARDLADLIDPSHTAVLTMEMQRGISGDLAMMSELADQLRVQGTVDNIVAVVDGARAVGARVVHCTAESRPDGAGRRNNCRLLAATAAGAAALVPGSDAASLLAELGPEDADLVVSRLHGLTPFTGTSLDQLLRNLDITTVVVTGASVNVGVLGLVLSAVDLGYQVVVPTDAVAGIPSDYADAVLANTVSLLATLTTSAELVAAWR